MINKLDIFAAGKPVGTLLLTKDRRVLFQYSEEWLKSGFSLNPLKLPLSEEVFVASSPYFRGLFGVFADSLPDSFGELLLERHLRNKGADTSALTCLDRLAYVGSSGMGILEYVPDLSPRVDREIDDFDAVQKECNALLNSKEVEDIDALFALGGSSGGSRPKSLIRYKGEEWIVKFSSRFDPSDIADLEYRCMSLAKQAGISIPDIDLIETKNGHRYFLIKRFDRGVAGRKIHMISVAALLETDFLAPSLDYVTLIKLTRILTKDEDDVLEMFRRMVFNVLIDNQDDHAKNFAFLYDETSRSYRLSPAYDLTPGKTYFGEHTTSVNGKGKDIQEEDMLAVAKQTHIPISAAKAIIETCQAIVSQADFLRK